MSTRGFSAIELIIVMAIISIVTVVSVLSYKTSKLSGESRHDSYVYVDAMREAEFFAQSSNYDTDWGVKITGGNTIVFSGSSYASRTSSRDRVYDTSNTINISGNTEIVFSKFYGTPNVTGTTTFSNTVSSSSVVVSSTGFFTY